MQCGRRTDVVKLKTAWLLNGQEGFGKRIDKMFQSAKAFASLIAENPNFHLLDRPQSINVCFRYNEIDGVRREAIIRKKLIEQGLEMVNFSQDKEGPFFRLAITRPDLTHEHFTDLINSIEQVRGNL